ncbi:unnamed protein product [Caenorhabditis brenneri]
MMAMNEKTEASEFVLSLSATILMACNHAVVTRREETAGQWWSWASECVEQPQNPKGRGAIKSTGCRKMGILKIVEAAQTSTEVQQAFYVKEAKPIITEYREICQMSDDVDDTNQRCGKMDEK